LERIDAARSLKDRTVVRYVTLTLVRRNLISAVTPGYLRSAQVFVRYKFTTLSRVIQGKRAAMRHAGRSEFSLA
jgi:hypothetical protein